MQYNGVGRFWFPFDVAGALATGETHPEAEPWLRRWVTPLMSENDLVVRFPHSLGAAEAKRRIAAGVATAQTQYGQFLKVAAAEWVANRLDFRASALAQSVTGSIDVGDDYVELRAELPLLIRTLAKKFLPALRDTGTKLLTKA